MQTNYLFQISIVMLTISLLIHVPNELIKYLHGKISTEYSREALLGGYSCEITMEAGELGMLYDLVVSVVCYALPWFLVMGCNVAIIYQVKTHTITSSGRTPHQSSKLTIICLALSINYLLYNLIRMTGFILRYMRIKLTYDIYAYSPISHFVIEAIEIFSCLLGSNVNCFIYLFTGRKFRNVFISLYKVRC